MTGSLASAIYNTLYNNCPQYARPHMKHKCELDLNCSYDDADWTKSLEQDHFFNLHLLQTNLTQYLTKNILYICLLSWTNFTIIV